MSLLAQRWVLTLLFLFLFWGTGLRGQSPQGPANPPAASGSAGSPSPAPVNQPATPGSASSPSPAPVNQPATPGSASSPSPAPPKPPGAISEEEKEKEIQRQEQSQRMLGVIPNFGTTSRHDAPPLSSGAKFHLFAKSAFDPVELSVVGLQAGVSQGEDEFPEYGQGAAGFGKRYGATLADEVSSGFFANYFYPVLLKEDPRYFRRGEGSIGHRIGYSLLQEVYAPRDNGGRGIAWENILGAFTAGGLSNAYYPAPERGFGLTMSRSAISVGYGSLGGLVEEFYPDIHQWLFHRHDKTVAQH